MSKKVNKTVEERLAEVTEETIADKPKARTGVRKTPRGKHVNTWLSVPASIVLEQLQAHTGSRAYDILSSAVVYYGQIVMNPKHPLPMHAAFMGETYASTPRRGVNESATMRELKAAKIGWCEEFGGRVEGNICFFDKYEVTLAGTTEINKRTIAINEIPDDKTQFQRLVMGTYDNVYEARRAAGRD